MFHVVMATVNPGVTIDDVQRVIRPHVVSYYRISPNVWVVYSYRINAKFIAEVLKDVVLPSGRIFVGRLDLGDKNGWMDQPFWDWVKQQQAIATLLEPDDN